eukprot:1597613-Alexandrium_andersonii.AAC.1
MAPEWCSNVHATTASIKLPNQSPGEDHSTGMPNPSPGLDDSSGAAGTAASFGWCKDCARHCPGHLKP